MTSRVNETKKTNGWINGLIGVIIFSGSLPATRIAVQDFSPLFLTTARAIIAGLLAICMLLIFKQRLPGRRHLFSLVIVSIGVVLGFPLLTAYALQFVTSAHSIVFVGMLPLVTAVFGVIRGREKPHPVFWIFAVLGSVLVTGYAVAEGISASHAGDILMLLAIILCGLGYAEGAKLSKTLGGWQVISWALVLALPLMTVLSLFASPSTLSGIDPEAWMGLIYVSLFSMFIGFIFWYRGLSQGGIAAVSQLQLLQPLFGLGLAATLLNEEISKRMLLITIGVVVCVAFSKKFAK